MSKSLRQLSREGLALFREASQDSTTSEATMEEQQQQQQRYDDELAALDSIYNNEHETPFLITSPNSCSIQMYHRSHCIILLAESPPGYPSDSDDLIPRIIVQNFENLSIILNNTDVPGYNPLEDQVLDVLTKAAQTLATESQGQECLYTCCEEVYRLLLTTRGGKFMDSKAQADWIQTLGAGDSVAAPYYEEGTNNFIEMSMATIVRKGKTAARVQWTFYPGQYSTVSFADMEPFYCSDFDGSLSVRKYFFSRLLFHSIRVIPSFLHTGFDTYFFCFPISSTFFLISIYIFLVRF